jgi:O-succinylbenzoic acid--CoA ligase
LEKPTLSISRAAAECAHRIALVAEGREYSYRELAARALERGRSLLERTPAGSCLGVVGSNRFETVVTLLACWETAICPVLLHPRLTESERLALCSTNGITRVLSEATELDVPGAGDAPRRANAAAAAIIFTSGTSGRAKGAVLSHGAFIASARASEFNLGWRDDDRWLLGMPLAHVGGLSIVSRTMLANRTAVLDTFRGANVRAVLDTIERERITIASLVPTMLRRIFDEEPAYRFPRCLRALLLGGAPSSPTLLEEARARGVPALTTYGMTETCSQMTTQRLGTPPGAEHGAGHPLDGFEIRTSEAEIQVRGPALMSGYLVPSSDELERPFLPGGWFRTGDLGELDDDGRLHLRGRANDMLITGGENVYPLEVEQALEGAANVLAACVFGVADEVWGDLVVCAVVPRAMPGGVPEREAFLRRLGTFARDHLAPHKRPRKVALLESLPVNASGKLDRRATKEAAAAQLAPLRVT